MTWHRWDSVPKEKFARPLPLERPSDVFSDTSFRGSFLEPRLHLRFETATYFATLGSVKKIKIRGQELEYAEWQTLKPLRQRRCKASRGILLGRGQFEALRVEQQPLIFAGPGAVEPVAQNGGTQVGQMDA